MSLFKDDDDDTWVLFFYGSSNALGHGIGAVLISPERQYIPMTARLCFDCTNNIAEYETCVMGIRAAIDFKVRSLKIYGDFAFVIHQIRGELETHDCKLIPY